MIQVVERSSKCDACNLKGTCSDKKKESQCAEERMSKVKHKILIGSGKGGVGKSTVTVNLARALSLKGYAVGIIDADITGPNIPKLLGIEDQRLHQGPEGIEPGDAQGIKVVSMALLLSSRESAVVWRGPMKMGAIKQFIADVNWGRLDFLLIDLPPGTSDEPLSVVQLIPDMTGAIIVTTPQEVSLLDSRKAINMIKSMKVPVLGLIENMSGLCCPHCGETINIFSTGGGKKAAGEMEVPFLGSIPIDPEICMLGDAGSTFVEKSIVARDAFEMIVDNLLKIVSLQ
ncbi:MAG TPA: Mrp/NBP35 family ATP-binding protein [Methanotrichaceae archaeon]|nr:Mrp/NBP35 family ATP-binding protein [Methanotrichaceae archaeon]